MSPYIAGYLTQDGLANGAVYCLLALALVFVFAVTRIILIPQGEFVSYAALTYILLREGRTPGTVGLVVLLVAVTVGVELLRALRRGELRDAVPDLGRLSWPPLLAAALTYAASRVELPALAHAVVTVVLIATMGPLLYRLVYRPIARASILVLLVVSVALHLVLNELGLFIFGPGGGRTAPLVDISFSIGGVPIQAQSIVVYAVTALLVVLLFVASERTLYGKALRAAAINPTGAWLMGISASMAGSAAFLVAAFIGAVAGVLISSVTTMYYDTGFLLGLKGFVAAIIGGLASHPLSAAGALGLGVLESFASFAASAFKEAIVFALIIPVLLWRSMASRRVEDEE
ncbi:MAG TPA: branched-chain amino acid ABC transporter permease [Azospirillum sp.]|nr:branched-chain amino acid ABC transporter permease [Azospirillum sp.]